MVVFGLLITYLLKYYLTPEVEHTVLQEPTFLTACIAELVILIKDVQRNMCRTFRVLSGAFLIKKSNLCFTKMFL